MIIDIIDEDRESYIDLLLLADPDREVVNSYLNLGDLFGVYVDGEVVSIALVIGITTNICEIKNIATKADFQQKGYAKKLINYIENFYKNQYELIIVGTANASFKNIEFYKNCGFRYYKTIDNFFVDNYTEAIFEDEEQCTDMLYFKKTL